MANKGRPLGSKKQGAPKKIIEKLDQILRYHNDLSLLDNIQNWVTQSCHANISLPFINNEQFEYLKSNELDDDKYLRLEYLNSYMFAFGLDQYHLLHIAHLKILDEIISKNISPQTLRQTILDSKNSLVQSNISYSVIAVSPPPFEVLSSIKVNLSERLHNLLRTEEFQAKMKAPYLEFWEELEKILISLCKYEEKLKQEPKLVYKFNDDDKDSQEKLIDALFELEHGSILEVLPPKVKNREHVSKFFGLKRTALKNGLAQRRE